MHNVSRASMVKLVNTADLKFADLTVLPVRFRFEAPSIYSLIRGVKNNPISECHNATFVVALGGILFTGSWSIPLEKLNNPYESMAYVSDRKLPTMPLSHSEDLKSLDRKVLPVQVWSGAPSFRHPSMP